MNPADTDIEMDPFDREYGLEDLLPAALTGELLADIDGCCTVAVLRPDGDVHFGSPDKARPMPPSGDAFAAGPVLQTGGKRQWVWVRLEHELETVGYLVLAADDAGAAAQAPLLALGRFAGRLVNRMLQVNYRLLMTAGLHGQVVSDAYARLKEKAEQLALSEARYRALAQSLEIEVEKKTAEIRNAHLLMLQQEKMAAVGQLAAGMAHEINNPMGFIISNLNTLKSTTGDVAELIARYQRLAGDLDPAAGSSAVAAHLAAIDRHSDAMDLDFILEDTQSLIDESLDGAKRVKIIVQNLRDFTHPSVDSAESVNVNDCLDTTLAILSSHVSPAVTIHRQYREVPLVRCRLREINQVFFNILKNGFQAVDDQGTVTIATDSDPDGVIVRISDNGPGIPAADQDRIFDPFFTTREVGEGTGLGLFNAYNSIKTLGGTITVTSPPGAGCTVIIRIPAGGDDTNSQSER